MANVENHLYLTAVCTTGSSVLFSHIRGSKASSSHDFFFLWLNTSHSSSGCALIFKTKDWQQGGEDRGISEGQQAECYQVTAFKALENLLFPGSTPCVCFLAVCASVNEPRGHMCTFKKPLHHNTNSQADWCPLITAKNQTLNRTLHQTFKTWSPNY